MRAIEEENMNLPRGSSFLLGALGASVVFLLLGAQAAGVLKLMLSGPVEIVGHPRPDQMHIVMEGAAFLVPANKLYVITGLGSNGHNFAPGPAPNKHVRVSFNG